MTPDPDRVQAIFLMVLDQSSPADRTAVLDHECRTDGELRRRVEALLTAHGRPGGLLDRPFVLSVDRACVEPGGADDADNHRGPRTADPGMPSPGIPGRPGPAPPGADVVGG